MGKSRERQTSLHESGLSLTQYFERGFTITLHFTIVAVDGWYSAPKRDNSQLRYHFPFKGLVQERSYDGKSMLVKKRAIIRFGWMHTQVSAARIYPLLSIQYSLHLSGLSALLNLSILPLVPFSSIFTMAIFNYWTTIQLLVCQTNNDHSN